MMPAINLVLAQSTVAYYFSKAETSTVRSIALVVVVVRGGGERRTGRGNDSQGVGCLMGRTEHKSSTHAHGRGRKKN